MSRAVTPSREEKTKNQSSCIERPGNVGIAINKWGCLLRQRKETAAVSCDRIFGSLRVTIRDQADRMEMETSPGLVSILLSFPLKMGQVLTSTRP